MSEQNNSFGSELKKLRKNKKLTVRSLADLSGTSHSYLSQIENERVNPPKPDMIKKIAKGLSSSSSRFEYFEIFDFLMKKAGYVLNEKMYKIYDEVFDEDSQSPNNDNPFIGKRYINGEIIKNGKLSISLSEYLLNPEIEITLNEKTLTEEDKLKLLEIANTIFY
ncbi:helix-turn-helix domain-containing protein [Psychrobacillus antarcticus]|uniref:helix-turn-helix domain-containing protein n=1 Tax=Psychrobacillus antarcticus TaxID=2879115 RepID=UPI002407BC70|nr:helix-turn-helix transcriptional regulator [Psychrobacillus antarcticus]